MPFRKHICRDIFTDKTKKTKSKWSRMTFFVTTTCVLWKAVAGNHRNGDSRRHLMMFVRRRYSWVLATDSFWPKAIWKGEVNCLFHQTWLFIISTIQIHSQRTMYCDWGCSEKRNRGSQNSFKREFWKASKQLTALLHYFKENSILNIHVMDVCFLLKSHYSVIQLIF